MSAESNLRDGRIPFALAFAGFVPFAVLTGAQFAPGDSAVESWGLVALDAYAAIILSFLGGIRWGIAVRSTDPGRELGTFVLSVVPSLWAWAAFFAPDAAGFTMYAIGFAAMGWWDRALVARGEAPEWFGLLRVTLTLLVAPTMLLAALAHLL